MNQVPEVRPTLVAAVQSPDNVVASHLFEDRLFLVFRDGSVAVTRISDETPTWSKVIVGPDYGKLFND